MNSFKIISDYKPLGDQPQAIKSLSNGLKNGLKHQTLLGITGSGKTFTMANVIQEVQKPTLVMSHNKTLAAQLYEEFKELFPDNAVEYVVDYDAERDRHILAPEDLDGLLDAVLKNLEGFLRDIGDQFSALVGYADRQDHEARVCPKNRILHRRRLCILRPGQ